jgi:hypothetical protein
MRKLSDTRRRTVLLASSATICATSPLLLMNHTGGRAHDLLFGIGIGLSIPLLIASAILLKRDRSACASNAD